MPIDPSIPLQAKGVQLESPVNQLTMMNEALKYGEMNRAIGEQNQLNEYIKSGADLASAEGKRGLLNYGKTGIAHAKAIGDIEKSGLETKKLQNDTKLQGLEFAYQGARNMVANPTNENIIAWGQDSVMNGYASADHVNSQVKQILAMPVDQRRAYLGSLGAKAKDMIDQYMISKTDQAKINISQGHLNIAKENAVSPESQGLISKAILEGRLDPTKVNSRNRNIIASTLMANPTANLRQLTEDAASGLTSSRTIGTQEANVSMAASEARKMITIANDYSAKVNRTEYPNINAISNAVSKGTGDANIVQLNTALNSLVNVYARAINPKGVATVDDKKHARELVNSAYSSGQLSGIFQVMDQEMAAAQVAGKEARKVLRGGATSPAGASSPALPPGFTADN